MKIGDMYAFIKIKAGLGQKSVMILMEKLHMTSQDIPSVSPPMALLLQLGPDIMMEMGLAVDMYVFTITLTALGQKLVMILMENGGVTSQEIPSVSPPMALL